MITCPSCQNQNEDGASFCNQCGYPLPNSDATPDPPTSAPASSDNTFPPTPPPEAYAPPQAPPPTEMPYTYASQPPSEPEQNNNQGILIAAIAAMSILVVAAVSAGVFFANRSAQPDVATSPTPEETSPATPNISPSATPSPSPLAESSSLDASKDFTNTKDQVWKVVSPSGLNCRSGPGTSNAIVRTFPTNQELALNSRYDAPIKTDAQGNPWLAIGQPGVDCFVRANTALIAAIPGKTPPVGGTVTQDNCPGDTRQTYFAETKGFYLNLCEAVEEPGRLYYVGTAKNGSGDITLPIETSNAKGYSAKNAETTYLLDLDNQRLLVTQAGKTIFNEKFISSGAVQ